MIEPALDSEEQTYRYFWFTFIHFTYISYTVWTARDCSSIEPLMKNSHENIKSDSRNKVYLRFKLLRLTLETLVLTQIFCVDKIIFLFSFQNGNFSLRQSNQWTMKFPAAETSIVFTLSTLQFFIRKSFFCSISKLYSSIYNTFKHVDLNVDTYNLFVQNE